jgi:tRNA U34 5-methylaminomethyl-2-thiouridine-forming methyltransferase MnmC
MSFNSPPATQETNSLSQNAEILNNIGKLVKTSDGSLTLEHHEHGETYHSDLGARTEAEELYLKRSGILTNFAKGTPVRVLDVGLGLGYNALTTIAAWMTDPTAGDLFILSLEINFDLIKLLATSKAEWQQDWPMNWLQICSTIESSADGQWSAKIKHPESGSEMNWLIIGGDALNLNWTKIPQGCAFNFIWQDAFSPKTCPQLWKTEWFAALHAAAAADCIMMTYSVARMVRDQMNQAGWKVERIAGSGKKKHWLRAINTNET